MYLRLFPVGSIIRCMRRLEEVLRQMCSAAKAIGNTELENKFAEGKKHQKRLIGYLFFFLKPHINIIRLSYLSGT